MFPPENPNIILYNYLLNLRENIKIGGVSFLIKKWHDKRFPTYSLASKDIGISESFYRRIVTGKMIMPIWVLKLIFKIDPKLINKIFQEDIYFTGKDTKDLLPKSINPQLAYYIGYLHGDGHINSNGKCVSFFDKYIGQLEVINRLTKSLFNVKGRVYIKKSKALVLDIHRISIHSFLSDVLGLKKGKRDSNKIPDVIKKKKILLRWYLCGLFDAEGAMPLHPKKRRDLYIDIAMKDIELINSVKIILEEVFNIKAYGPYKKIAKNRKIKKVTVESELKIRKLSEIKKFLIEIGTIHPDKVRRKGLILNLLKDN